jgi:hypothetical protein
MGGSSGREYNRTPSDIFELQENNITRDLGESQAKADKHRAVTYSETLHRQRRVVPFVYQRQVLPQQRLTETVEQATEYFRKAIDADPEYAPAYGLDWLTLIR